MGGNYFQLPPTRGFIIWDKEQPFDNFSACEFAWTSFNMPSKIYQEATTRTGEIKIHPTQKSVKLYTWIFKRYLPNGGKVIDTHGGSMSSVISAAKAGNIEMVCSEIDEYYFNDAEKRIKTYFDQGNLFQSKPDIIFIR